MKNVQSRFSFFNYLFLRFNIALYMKKTFFIHGFYDPGPYATTINHLSKLTKLFYL